MRALPTALLVLWVSALGAVGVALGGEMPEMVPGVAIFKLDPKVFVDIGTNRVERLGIPSIDQVLHDIGATGVERKFPYCQPPLKSDGTDLRPIYNVYFPPSLPVNEVVRRLLEVPEVEFAHPWWVDQVLMNYNDPRRDEQWNLDLVMAPDAHDVTTGSREVVIAIVDLGIDLQHEDLAANIWINPGEDINGDGMITDEDRNNADDDSSGFADDFYGWDFVGNDNDPTDQDGHGTQVSGIASAVTNNRTGIASIGYSCALMAVRTGQGNQILRGYEGIEYAARVGARVINCSWGGTQRSDAAQQVINYAYERGVLVVAACGNSNSQAVFYPAGYDHVISVAATDNNDRKASFSTFGRWVDISAPGVGVLTTARGNSYGAFAGTSAASPHVAGAAGLLFARYPDATPDVVADFLLMGADNIDSLNPGYEGMLGSGRLNVLRSLVALDQPLPVIAGIDLVYEDNGNGRVDPGEEASFVVTVLNRGQQPEEMIARLHTDDPSIEVVRGEVVLPNLEMGQRYTNYDEPFQLAISPLTIPHTSRFRIVLSVQPGDIVREMEYEFIIGHPNILIVDDDGGLEYERSYTVAIDTIRQGWLRWDTSRRGSPPPDVLTDHHMVIWETGDAYPPLDEFDRRSLRMGIEQGAKILLIGRGIGDDPDNRSLLRGYFGANHRADSVAATVAVAVPGRPVLRGDDAIFLMDGRTNEAMISPSSMVPFPPGDSLLIYIYEGAENGVAGVYREDFRTGAKSVYLGFTLASASDWGTPKTEIIREILYWFAPELRADWEAPSMPITHLLEPAYPNPFNGLVRIDFQLGSKTPYRLVVSDLQGREVEVIRQGEGSTGRHSLLWRANHLPSGVYWLKLETSNFPTLTRKLVLLK